MVIISQIHYLIKEMLEPIVHKATSFHEADMWDIKQHTQMTHEERQNAARKLRERYYGKYPPDVRDTGNIK